MQGGPARILVLNGSPHRAGNTATLLAWTAEGCREKGAQVEWLHLVDYSIEYCRGCMLCLRTGACPQADDLAAVRDRLLEGDGIIVGAPVYEGFAPAQMKTFMDRLTLLNLYTRTFARQRTVGVATSGVAPTMGVARDLADFFGRRVALVGAQTTTVADGFRRLDKARDRQLRARAQAAGRRLVANITTPTKAGLPTPMEIWFRCFLWPRVVRPLVIRHPDQFEGVIRIWREKGLLTGPGGEGVTA